MPPPDDFPTATHNGHPPAPSTAPGPTPKSHSTAQPAGSDADFERWVEGGATPGRYRWVKHHKQGGLGIVSEAEDTVVGRRVALKTLRPERTDPTLKARFKREAQITGQLEHPNIVPLYDLFDDHDGPTYVMRFLDGDTLAAAAKAFHEKRKHGAAGPLDLPKLLSAFVLVCEAVAYAHSKGVLHRDLKGANILLGRFGEVCLADWGLAKRIGDPDRPGDPSPLSPPLDPPTIAGAVMGTPAYMAPEVAAKGKATPASDVYGLGAVLYQLLTDAVPHTGTTPEEILSKINDGEPVPPPRVVNPSLHPALDAVCRKALSRRPADRYPSATALADDVRAFLAGEPVAAYPEPFLARAGRWGRRHRAGVLAGVVGLAVFAVASLGWGARVYQEKKRAEANYDLASDLAYSVTDAVIQTETGLLRGRSETATRRATVGRAADAAERLLAVQPDDPEHLRRTATLLRFAGNLARVADDLPDAERSFAASARLQRQLVAAHSGEVGDIVTLALTLRDAGVVAMIDDRLTAAIDLIGQAVNQMDQLGPVGLNTPGGRRALGLTLNDRAEIMLKLGWAVEAEAEAARAVTLLAGLLEAPDDGRQPLDAVFRGVALNIQAQAQRELVSASGNRDYSLALATHAEAAEVYRWAIEVNPGVDARLNAHRAQLELANTRIRAGQTDAALTDASTAVAGLRQIWADRRGVPLYQHQLAVGLTVRGTARAAQAFDPIHRGLAAADFHTAAALLEPLILDSPTRPAYRAAYGDAWTGLARLATNRDGQVVWYYQAVSAYKSAVKYAPEHRGYRAMLEAVRKEAIAAGVDPDQRPERLAPAGLRPGSRLE